MLRRAAFLLGARAAWLRLHPSRPVTTAAALLRCHPEVRPGLSPAAPLQYLDAVGARGYARMARRIPPARPDGYSTSDGEADAYGDEEDMELGAAGADGEAGAAEGKEWEGYMLGFDSGTDEDDDEEAATEKEEK